MIRNLAYSDSESDEDESNRFFSVCAENKINAMIARMRENEENYDRPEEFENEAVTMAIQQHGLRHYIKTEKEVCECRSEVNENHCNQNVVGESGNQSNEPTTSKLSPDTLNVIEGYYDDDKCPMSRYRNRCVNSEIQNLAYKQNINSEGYDFDDIDFLNEAVGVAITKKGLSSSCNASK